MGAEIPAAEDVIAHRRPPRRDLANCRAAVVSRPRWIWRPRSATAAVGSRSRTSTCTRPAASRSPQEAAGEADGPLEGRPGAQGATAYTPQNLEARTLGWSAMDQQMVEDARRYMATQLARMAGVNPVLVSAAMGSSVQLRIALDKG